MAGTVAEAMQNYLSAIGANALARTREGVAAAVRARLIKGLLHGGVDGADAPDQAQEKTTGLVAKLLGGAAAPGSEDAYVFRAGLNRARDLRRRQSAEARRGEGPVLPTAPEDLEVLALTAPERDLGALGEAALALLESPSMPKAYREAILRSADDADGTEQVLEELRDRPTGRDGRLRTFEQAQNSVHQRLSRARRWIAERLAEAPPPPRPGPLAGREWS